MNNEKDSYEGYRWLRAGDVNAFFGLMLDNVVGLILMVGILAGFGFPTDFAVSALVPGTALGVMVGDLAFFYFAFRLAKRTGRSDVTAMPLGLDTPSTFGYLLFILGPSFDDGVNTLGLTTMEAAYRTWHIGIWCIVMSGVIKLLMAPFTEWIRKTVPRAGLLGSLAAIALVLITFFPLVKILGHPLPGILALVIVLVTLIGRIPLPGRTPGSLGALIVAGLIYYALCVVGGFGYELPANPEVQWFPTRWLEAWDFEWLNAFGDALPYLPIALPFAIGTVVGGIDCTESAAAAGDVYDTRTVIAVEGVATLLAGLSGGVIQTTPYIGHPAYKAMGGRAGYTLGTALLIGSAGLVGYFAILNAWIPEPVVMPILVFVGLEITAQSFLATPRRHYPAVALACLPALAALAIGFPERMLGGGITGEFIPAETMADKGLFHEFMTIKMLSNGFILTSLLWAWMLAAAIDRKLKTAGYVMVGAAILTLFGIIHSPLPGNRLFVPYGPESWGAVVLEGAHRAQVMEFALGYAAAAAFFFVLLRFPDLIGPPLQADDDESIEPSH